MEESRVSERFVGNTGLVPERVSTPSILQVDPHTHHRLADNPRSHGMAIEVHGTQMVPTRLTVNVPEVQMRQPMMMEPPYPSPIPSRGNMSYGQTRYIQETNPELLSSWMLGTTTSPVEIGQIQQGGRVGKMVELGGIGHSQPHQPLSIGNTTVFQVAQPVDVGTLPQESRLPPPRFSDSILRVGDL